MLKPASVPADNRHGFTVWDLVQPSGKITMEEKSVPTNESPDFLCPSCGSAAFEVVEKQKYLREGDEPEEFLVLRCLACLELFHHQLALAEPAECLLNP
jgi:DNA-directed RNA polymerase subunit M/transcription elongation factor TFIIS